MGLLLNESICARGPHVPESIRTRLSLLATCELTVSEIAVFSHAFQVFADFIADDPAVHPESHVTSVFLDRDSFSLTLDDTHEFGLCASMVLYPLHRWRAANMGNVCMYACIFEELCHHFYIIRDEIAVKYKVAELMRIIFPDFEIGSFYKPEFLRNAACQE